MQWHCELEAFYSVWEEKQIMMIALLFLWIVGSLICMYKASDSKSTGCFVETHLKVDINESVHHVKLINTLRPRQSGRYFADDIFNNPERKYMNFA